MKDQKWMYRYCIVAMLCFASVFCLGQTPTDSVPRDPGGLTVYTIQNMNFGAFSRGSNGGSITITTTGSRYVSGDVIALNLGFQFFQAIFEIEAPAGSIISIYNGPDATLTGNNGGTMLLHIGNSEPASPFTTTIPSPGRTQINVGGTLTVGTPLVTLAGTYTGTFYLTFNQE